MAVMAERMHPRLGAIGLLTGSPFAFLLIFNTWLGLFPAIIVKTPTGGLMKYHPLEKLFSIIGIGNGKLNWSEAGVVTMQDWVQILIVLVSSGVAWYGLRNRPAFDGPVSRDIEAERAAMESGELGPIPSMTSGISSPFTAQIIDEVIGRQASLDAAEVSSALGQLSVMAEANAAAEDYSPKESIRRDDLPDIEPIHPEIEEISSPEVEDGSFLDGITSLGGDDYDSQDASDSPASGVASAVASIEDAVARPRQESEAESARSLPPLPGRPNSTILESTSSESTSSEAKSNTMGTADSTKSVQTESKPIRSSALPPVPGRKNLHGNSDKVEEVGEDVAVATKSSELTARSDASSPLQSSESEPLSPDGKSSTYSGSMPVRPDGLPQSAEYDPDTGQWLLHGAPLGDTLTPLSS